MLLNNQLFFFPDLNTNKNKINEIRTARLKYIKPYIGTILGSILEKSNDE